MGSSFQDPANATSACRAEMLDFQSFSTEWTDLVHYDRDGKLDYNSKEDPVMDSVGSLIPDSSLGG